MAISRRSKICVIKKNDGPSGNFSVNNVHTWRKMVPHTANTLVCSERLILKHRDTHILYTQSFHCYFEKLWKCVISILSYVKRISKNTEWTQWVRSHIPWGKKTLKIIHWFNEFVQQFAYIPYFFMRFFLATWESNLFTLFLGFGFYFLCIFFRFRHNFSGMPLFNSETPRVMVSILFILFIFHRQMNKLPTNSHSEELFIVDSKILNENIVITSMSYGNVFFFGRWISWNFTAGICQQWMDGPREPRLTSEKCIEMSKKLYLREFVRSK